MPDAGGDVLKSSKLGPAGLRSNPPALKSPGPQPFPVRPIVYPLFSSRFGNTAKFFGKIPKWFMASSSCQVLRPVKMLARQGLHFGFDVNAFLKRTPSRAIRSKFGVLTHSLPYAPESFQPQSSKMMNRIFGRVFFF